MGHVILVCGLNGAGKSTLAKALADKIGYCFVDMEDIYYSKAENPNYPYENPRSSEESIALLLDVFAKEHNVILASVSGDFGEEVQSHFQQVIYLELPRDIRLKRVYDRSYDKFGEKMREGGEFYEQVKSFHDFVASRDEHLVEDWLSTLSCPIIRLDGTLPIQNNVELLTGKLLQVG